MSSTKKFGALIIIAIAIISALGIGIARSSLVRAQTGTTTVYGWAWSSNIGWISFNSDQGGGGPHKVVIDQNNLLSGWAWSSNIGWIKFGGLSGFPSGGSTAGNAQVVINGGGSGVDIVAGWARACAATVNKDCNSATRTDGWDGWIELSGTNHTVRYQNNAITGYAWGGDVVGWIDFVSVSTIKPIPPAQNDTCTLSASSGAAPYTLTWNAPPGTLCTGVNFMPTGTSGSIIVSPNPITNTTYSMSCSPSRAGVTGAFCSAEIRPTCTVEPCGPVNPDDTGIIMWLNDAPDENDPVAQVRAGLPVKINWKATKGDAFAACVGRFDGAIDTAFTQQARPKGNPYIKTDLTSGWHTFTMSCTTNTVPPKSVAGRNPGDPQQGISASNQLRIRILDSDIKEE